jgi:hypothetical protein
VSFLRAAAHHLNALPVGTARFAGRRSRADGTRWHRDRTGAVLNNLASAHRSRCGRASQPHIRPSYSARTASSWSLRPLCLTASARMVGLTSSGALPTRRQAAPARAAQYTLRVPFTHPSHRTGAVSALCLIRLPLSCTPPAPGKRRGRGARQPPALFRGHITRGVPFRLARLLCGARRVAPLRRKGRARGDGTVRMLAAAVKWCDLVVLWRFRW